MVAVDRAHAGNGCLEVLRGSHALGRVEHAQEELGEMHADPERVALIEAAGHERVSCALEPGDALFFHANLLHQSRPNSLPGEPRWAFICCFNTLHNRASKDKADDEIELCPVWPDSNVLQYGRPV
eukprot:SAG22_NODE_10906_length_510_cov_1.873479_2_plen_125_part_01